MKTFRVDKDEPFGGDGRMSVDGYDHLTYAVYANSPEEARGKVGHFVTEVKELCPAPLSAETEELLEEFGIKILR